MATLTKPEHRLLTIASSLGILQGIAWFVMSLICIILYLESVNSVQRDPPTSQSYMAYVEYGIFTYLLWGNSAASGNLMTPHAFTIFMWIYLIASLMWIVISVLQLRTINQLSSNPLNLMKCWGVLTCLVSLIDFLLVVLLGAEHNEYCMPSVPDLLTETICTNVLIPVLVIAARGFLLWIINVIFVYITYRIIKTIQTGKNLDKRLLAVDKTIPRASLYSPTSTNSRSLQPTPTSHHSSAVWPHQPSMQNSNNGSLYSNRPGSLANNSSSGNFWSHNPRPKSYEPTNTPPTSPAYYSNQQQPFANKY